MTYPFSLSILGVFVRHLISHAIGVEEGPDSELVQDANLQKDVERSEGFGLFVGAVGVKMGRFRHVLSPCIFVPVRIAGIH
jgi:hypothetical protein